MVVLEAEQRSFFIDELVAHLRDFAPKHSSLFDDPQLRSLVSSGVDRAATYGFTRRGPVRFFLEMSFMFGSGFDTDVQLPWVHQTLANKAMDEMTRADLVHEATLDYLRSVAGPNRLYTIEALHRLQRVRIEDWSVQGPLFEDHVLRACASLYPQKCEYLGQAVLREAIRGGRALAALHGAAAERWQMLFIALSFSIGHQFASDPLFPWISATLDPSSGLDGEARAAKLYSRSRIYLDHAISYLEAH